MRKGKLSAVMLAVLAAACAAAGISVWRSSPMFRRNDTGLHAAQGNGCYSNKRIKLNYIPEGFIVSEDNTNDMGVIIRFNDIYGGEGYFHVTISSADSSVHIDTEDAVVERLTVNGCEGLYSTKPNVNILLWGDDNYIYVIDGSIDKNEEMKIAENLVM